MSNLQRHTRYLINWVLAGVFLAPALVLAHGAVDIPIARQVHCKTLPDFWSGSPSDPGCAALDAVSGQYPGQQWNEVAHLIAAPGYNDPDTVKREVPDGQQCSAADNKKEGLNLVSADWRRTVVTPINGKMDVRIIGTAPHVPSFAKVYLTRSGFDPTTSPLTWNDLVLIHTEQLTVAQTNWGSEPPAIAGASGFFKFQVPIPSGQVGPAILFVHWQRIDPAGEGFYNCSDIHIAGATAPESYFDLGQFIDAIMSELKPGDSVHFRILDNSPAAKEVVDVTLPITAANLDPKIWGQQLANQVPATIAKVGEKQGNSVIFNASDPNANSVFALAKGYSKAMAIISDDGSGPGISPNPPTANLQGPMEITEGETVTYDGTGSTGHNGPLTYVWATNANDTSAGPPANHQSTFTFKVGRYVEEGAGSPPKKNIVKLGVYDDKNRKNAQKEIVVTIKKSGGGGQYPQWSLNNVNDYIPGYKVSNRGQNWECKAPPEGEWCKIKSALYEPGGTHGDHAWDKVP